MIIETKSLKNVQVFSGVTFWKFQHIYVLALSTKYIQWEITQITLHVHSGFKCNQMKKKTTRGGGGHGAIPGEKNCQIKAFKTKIC